MAQLIGESYRVERQGTSRQLHPINHTLGFFRRVELNKYSIVTGFNIVFSGCGWAWHSLSMYIANVLRVAKTMAFLATIVE